MKIACTTLGCPGWTLDDILKQLAASGYDGIDFRGLGDEMEVWKMPEFSTDIDATAEKIAAAGVVVSAFSSSVRMFAPDVETADKYIAEVSEYAKLCRHFGADIIRIFGGKIGDTPRADAIAASVESLRRLSEAAGEGVTLAVETHDDWLASAPLAEVIEKVNLPNVGVLWDLHHPYRMAGESPKTTYDNLGKYIVATHVKDSKLTAEKFEYCLAGEGDVPLAEMIQLLLDDGYDGYITLEWEKKWHPELPGAELALPSYAKFLRALG